VRPFECGERPCGVYGPGGDGCYACALFDAIERGERVDPDFAWNAKTGRVEPRSSHLADLEAHLRTCVDETCRGRVDRG